MGERDMCGWRGCVCAVERVAMWPTGMGVWPGLTAAPRLPPPPAAAAQPPGAPGEWPT